MNILYFLCNFLLSFFIFLKGTQILGFLKAKEYDSLSGYSSPDLEPGTKRWIRAQEIYGDALRKCGAGLMLLNVVGALSVFMLELPVIQIESVILLLLEILSFFGAKLWTRNQMAKDIVLTPSAPATPAGETAPADEGSNRSDASLEHADDAKSEAHKAEDENPDESPKETPAKAEETFTADTQDDAIPAERDDEKESVSEQEELEPDAAANEPDAAAQTKQPREASVPTDTNENEPAEPVLPAEDAHIHLAPSSSSAAHRRRLLNRLPLHPLLLLQNPQLLRSSARRPLLRNEELRRLTKRAARKNPVWKMWILKKPTVWPAPF